MHSENGAEYILIEDKKVKIAPENFKLIVPKGGLKEYESHWKNINSLSILYFKSYQSGLN